MRKIFPKLIMVVTSLAFPLTGLGDVTLSIASTDDLSQKTTVYVHGDQVRMDIGGSEANQSILYKRGTSEYIMLLHDQRTWRKVNIEAMAAQMGDMRSQMQQMMQQRMQGMPPEQQATMMQMMQKYQGVGAPMAPPTQAKRIEKTGKSDKVNGIACDIVNVMQGEEKRKELCVASRGALEMSTQDYASLVAMQQEMQKLSAIGTGSKQAFGVASIDELGGVPVRTISTKPGGSGRQQVLESISHDALKQEFFAVPSGYSAIQP